MLVDELNGNQMLIISGQKMMGVQTRRSKVVRGFNDTLCRSVLVIAAISCAGPARAQIVTQDRFSVLDALRRDLSIGSDVLIRQLAEPFTNTFGFPLLVAMLGLALVSGWPLRLWLLARWSGWLRSLTLDLKLSVSAKAVGTIVLTTLLLTVAGQIALWALEINVVLLPETQILARVLAIGIGIAGLGMGVGRALQEPDDPAARPLQIPSGLDETIGRYPLVAGVMLGLTNLIDQSSRLLHATGTSWNIAQGAIAVIEGLILARFLFLAGQAREREVEAAAASKKGPVVPAIFGMTALVWVALAIAGAAGLLGHIPIAVLILQELLWAGLVLTIAWLLTRFLDALLTQLFDADRTVGRFATAVVGVRRARVKQLALLASAILTIMVWLFAIGMVTAPLHGGHSIVVDQIRPLPLLNSVRSLDLSPRTVGMALLVLFIGIALTRIVRRWLEKRFLPSTSLDIGVRTSLVTGLSYFGILAALLSATNMLGVQLEKVTLIASALSVGIGFGLQSIIQNFVSGVILLIERPVKPGDWVAVSGAEGTIRRIRVRATELATADGGTAIVPNSSFISGNVSNQGGTRMSDRLDLTLTIGGCPNAAAARQAVLDMVKGDLPVRPDPAPELCLTTLGDGEWIFDLRVFVKPGISPRQARSEILLSLAAQSDGRDLKIKGA